MDLGLGLWQGYFIYLLDLFIIGNCLDIYLIKFNYVKCRQIFDLYAFGCNWYEKCEIEV